MLRTMWGFLRGGGRKALGHLRSDAPASLGRKGGWRDGGRQGVRPGRWGSCDLLTFLHLSPHGPRLQPPFS